MPKVRLTKRQRVRLRVRLGDGIRFGPRGQASTVYVVARAKRGEVAMLNENGLARSVHGAHDIDTARMVWPAIRALPFTLRRVVVLRDD